MSGQDRPFLFKADYPDYVPKNKSFEISVISRITDSRCNEMHFYLLVERSVSLESITYIDDFIKKNLKFREADFHDFYGKAFRVEINLDEFGLTHDVFYQLILKLNAYNSHDTKVAFGFECFYPNNHVRTFSSYDFLTANNPLPIVPIRFYEPQTKAGEALVLKHQSYFNIDFKSKDEQENILIEFWAKTGNRDKPFFKLVNNALRETILDLTINKNNILISNESEGDEYYQDFFISENSWVHYSIKLSNDERHLLVIANDLICLKKPLTNRQFLKDLSLQLMNNSKGKNSYIDLLKVWDFGNNLDISFLNKHYKNYLADSSKLYLSLDFDNYSSINDLRSSTQIQIEENNLSYTNSDAPIFSKAPELNVIIYGGFYSVEWQQRELPVAKEFILERSFGGKEFEPIHSMIAEDDLDKIYYFSDARKDDKEVVQYRLKQINKGGSSVYSSTVKIGLVEHLTFNLEQNFPNPFNPETKITIEMLEQDEVEIFVYDIVGKKIEKLHEGSLGQGKHSFHFNGSNLPSGIYFFEAKTPTASVVRKMILTK